MKVLFLTNEYPPHVYGGAGVHVDYLSRELARLVDVEVRAFGKQEETHSLPGGHSLDVRGFPLDPGGYTCPAPLKSVFGALERCTAFNTAGIDASLAHCHTWYSHWGGILAKLNYGLPLVLTVHSLEPLRPWKREQLGNGYDFTCWLERTALEMADAVIAVSAETRADVLRLFNVKPERLHVIHNGIDLDEYRKSASQEALRRHGIDPSVPYLLFVGRITRQKGIVHLVNAIRYMNPGFQVVLCAGAPDTPEIAAEMKAAVAAVDRPGVIWIQEMLERKAAVELYSHAAAFCCPSIYEPFGIINLEAMACETPVVASSVGGIKEVVVDGETGFLVPVRQRNESPFEPVAPDEFARDLAARVNTLMADPALREKMGKAGRRRVEEKFGWEAIARQTVALYREVLATPSARAASGG